MKDKTYFVTCETDCDECHGDGTITHPEWQKFFEEHRSQMLDEDEIDEWFHGEGYRFAPDEKVTCPECEGKGKLREEVTLESALANLLHH